LIIKKIISVGSVKPSVSTGNTVSALPVNLTDSKLTKPLIQSTKVKVDKPVLSPEMLSAINLQKGLLLSKAAAVEKVAFNDFLYGSESEAGCIFEIPKDGRRFVAKQVDASGDCGFEALGIDRDFSDLEDKYLKLGDKTVVAKSLAFAMVNAYQNGRYNLPESFELSATFKRLDTDALCSYILENENGLDLIRDYFLNYLTQTKTHIAPQDLGVLGGLYGLKIVLFTVGPVAVKAKFNQKLGPVTFNPQTLGVYGDRTASKGEATILFAPNSPHSQQPSHYSILLNKHG
jgi:hypothetical protein